MLSGFAGVRALAALAVVIYHLYQHLPVGLVGSLAREVSLFVGHFSVMVSVFFMLSGFFRSMSYWKVSDTPEKIPLFWPSLLDRWRRIAPAYYIVLVLSLAVTYLIHGTSWINIPAFLSGFAFLSWISPDTLFPVLLNGPLWFISFDMIGWILTSLFMMGYMKIQNSKFKIKNVLYFSGIILITLALHELWISLAWPTTGRFPANIWFPVYNPFLFFLHFLFGIAAAGIVNLMQKKYTPHVKYDILASVALLLSCATVWYIRADGDWAYGIPNGPYHFPWLTSLIAIVFISLPFTIYIGKGLDNPFFIFTAKLSYSIFLMHGVVMVLLLAYVFPGALTVDTWILFSLSTLTLSYLAAWILYRYVEVPLSPEKHK